MRLCDLVQPEAIVAELASSDRNGAIRELVEVLARSGAIEADSVESTVKSILTRERTRGTTGFGKGVAAPHAKIDGLARVVTAVGRAPGGIDFQSLDGGLVYSIFLILSPADQPDEHLRAMDLIFRNLQRERFRKFLRQAETPEAIHDLLKEADEQPPAS